MCVYKNLAHVITYVRVAADSHGAFYYQEKMKIPKYFTRTKDQTKCPESISFAFFRLLYLKDLEIVSTPRSDVKLNIRLGLN